MRPKLRKRTSAKQGQNQTSSQFEDSLTLLGPRKKGNLGLYHYSGFRMGEQTFRLNDAVFLRNPDSDADPYIGVIRDVFAPIDADLDEEAQAEVMWFYRPQDTALSTTMISKLSENEILASNCTDDNLLRAIETHCHVVEWSKRDEHPDADFYCRYLYDPIQNKLKPWSKPPAMTSFAVGKAGNGGVSSAPQKRGRTTQKSQRKRRKIVRDTLGEDGPGAVSADECDDVDAQLMSDSDASIDSKALNEETSSDEGSDSDVSVEEDFLLAENSRSARRRRGTGQQRGKGRGKVSRKPRASRSEETPPKRGAKKASPKKRGKRVARKITLPAASGLIQHAEGSEAGHGFNLKPKLSKDAQLPSGREVEFYEISGFIQDRICSGGSGCLFVSGVPGTGKTMTIRSVARDLQGQQAEESLPPFQFVEINAMSLTSPQQAYVELWRAVSGKSDSHVTPAHAADLLQKRFTTPSPRRQCCVVLIDEVDQLWTRKQDVLYNLFEWPAHSHSRLVLVAVANTMDLPERVLAERVSSRLGLARLTFQPYTRQQVSAIVHAMVDDVYDFEDDAIELCAMKVAATSGDARRAIHICRRAAEIARKHRAGSQSDESKLQVTVKTMGEAIDDISASPTVAFVANTTQHERLFLLSLIDCFRRSGVEEASFYSVQRNHIELCQRRGFALPSASALEAVCSRLGACRVLLVEAGVRGLLRRVRLNCAVDDVLFALRDDPTAQFLARAVAKQQAPAAAATSEVAGDAEDCYEDEGRM